MGRSWAMLRNDSNLYILLSAFVAVDYYSLIINSNNARKVKSDHVFLLLTKKGKVPFALR